MMVDIFLPNAVGRFEKLVYVLATVTQQLVDEAWNVLRETVE